jgi:arylsulfatase A-like enzyme
MLDRRTLLKLSAAIPGLLSTATDGAQASSSQIKRPNMIQILTDDMRFDDDRHMPNLKKLFRNHGTQFDCSFVPYPLCAPARVCFLTGLMPHNTGVFKNGGDQGGYEAYQTMEDNALPVWLTNAGYYVGHVGKFVNGYDKVAPDHIPPGYADWHVMSTSFDDYFNFTLNENGTQVDYTDGQYTTDVFIQKTLDFIAKAPQPWTLFLWPNCCHGPAVPAQQDAGTFANVDMPLPPSFNEADVSDKPSYIQKLPLLTDDEIAGIQDRWRARQETLQSLDRGLKKIIDALTTNGQIDNTHISFSSDNGFLEGEHRVDDHKNLLYDESARVPLYWLQPQGSKGMCNSPVTITDVTAAMLDLAQATPGKTIDGRSLVPLLSDPSGHKWNRATLLQCDESEGIATSRYRYVEWGFHAKKEYELYDMTVDPYQLNNQASNPDYADIRTACAAALTALRGCSGSTCSWTGHFPPPPK